MDWSGGMDNGMANGMYIVF